MQVDQWDVPGDTVLYVPHLDPIHVVGDGGARERPRHGGNEGLQNDEGNGGTLRLRYAALITEDVESEEACAICRWHGCCPTKIVLECLQGG